MNKEVAQGFRYLLVGGSTALLELGLFQLFSTIFGLPIAPSNIAAVILATACNFALNRNFTFNSSSNPLRSLVLYCLLFGFNLAFSTQTIIFLTDKGMNSAIAKLITQACVTCWNFVLYRTVIFPKEDK